MVNMIDLLSSQMFPPPKYYAIATVICSALCGFVGTHALVHFQDENRSSIVPVKCIKLKNYLLETIAL